jgi:hypothetical protein
VLTFLSLLWAFRSRVPSAIFLVGVSVITLGDLYAHHHKVYSFAQPTPRPRRDHELSALKRGERFVDQERWRWRAPARTLRPELSGRYSTMVSARYMSYMKTAEHHPQLLSLASVKLKGGRRELKRLTPAPFASLYLNLERCEREPFTPPLTLKAVPQALANLAREPRCPLLEVEPLVSVASRPLDHNVELKKPTPLPLTHHGWGEVEASLSAEALAQALLNPLTSLIVVNEAWAQGWEARLERPLTGEVGAWRPTLRANVLFQGLPVHQLLQSLPSHPTPSEALTLRLRYHPKRVIYALYLALCCVLMSVWVWWTESTPQNLKREP